MPDTQTTTDANANAGDTNASGASQTQATTTDANGATSTDNKTTGERTFTQRELEYELGMRLGRERAKFADYDDLKAKALKWDEGESARLSDIERATKTAEEATQRATAAEQALREERLRNAITGEARTAGAIDPDAVLALVDRGALINAKGEIEGVTEAVATLLESKPYLRGTARPAGNIGQRGSTEATSTSGGQFTRSQLRDPTFFAANREAIMQAAAAGQIVDDT
jgi:hypothetical protein